jgi:hypothetical protein
MMWLMQGGGVEKMTVTDCKVVFNLQKQILNAPELSPERKVEMLRECICDTLGEKDEKELEK